MPACRRIILLWPVIVAIALSACGKDIQPEPAAMELPATIVTHGETPLPLSYPARTQGVREIEVRARVSGILERRFYVEGAPVEAGQLLFRIDPAPFAEAVRSAQGRSAMEEARLRGAERQWRRIAALGARGFASRQTQDDAEAHRGASRAALMVARADLARARLELGYTDVRAPISGITGRETRSEGSLVNATDETALLTTITQGDRLNILFSMPDSEARLLRSALAGDARSVGVRILVEQRGPLPGAARIDFVSTQVAADTGTVDVRASYDNRGGLLSPGQFVRAELVGLAARAGAYIPARAIVHGAESPLVWIVDGAGKAAMRPVRLGTSVGNLVLVEQGLAPGDRVLLEGMMKLQPGVRVKPVVIRPETTPTHAPAR